MGRRVGMRGNPVKESNMPGAEAHSPQVDTQGQRGLSEKTDEAGASRLCVFHLRGSKSHHEADEGLHQSLTVLEASLWQHVEDELEK